ncbi:MAG TPA: hypothetical protein VNW93_12855, partial [Mycobacterium sp.]|nr:hypothetical protein [Mycobacterium sp.]
HVLDEELVAGTIAVSGESHAATIPPGALPDGPDWAIRSRFSDLDWPVIVSMIATTEGYRC